jgi:hypothetical protein
MFYKVAEGHDIPDIDLELLDPQPRGIPATPVKRQYGADNTLHDQGLYTEFHFDHIDGETAYVALLQQFGLDDQDTNNVTITCRDRRFQAVKYNGVALLPEPLQDMKWQNFFVRDVVITIINLEIAS